MSSTERFRIKFAVYVIPRDGDRVLLSLRQGTGWKDGWFSLVAGHVDGGEPAERAMIRETKEEIGIDIAPGDLRHVYTMHRLGDDPSDEYVDLFFECQKWSGDVRNLEPEKCGELRWVDINDLPENILEHVKVALLNYPKGVTYSSEERQ